MLISKIVSPEPISDKQISMYVIYMLVVDSKFLEGYINC